MYPEEDGVYPEEAGVYLLQLPDQPVVLPEEDGVEGGEGGLLAGPHVPRLEALARLSLMPTNLQLIRTYIRDGNLSVVVIVKSCVNKQVNAPDWLQRSE